MLFRLEFILRPRYKVGAALKDFFPLAKSPQIFLNTDKIVLVYTSVFRGRFSGGLKFTIFIFIFNLWNLSKAIIVIVMCLNRSDEFFKPKFLE